LTVRAGPRGQPQAVLGIVALVLPIVTATALAFASGGYFISDWGLAGIGLLAAVATCAVVVDSGCGPWGRVALAGWLGLAIWQGVSAVWASQPSAAVTTMGLTLVYAGAFALGLIGVRRSSDVTTLAELALAGSAVVAGYALAARLLPGLVAGDDEARLAAPLSYWNGLGVVCAFAVILAVGLAGDPDLRARRRCAHAALVPPLLLALLLTYSRGALAALLVGMALLLALAPGRLESLGTLIVCGGASLPLLLAANADDRIAAISGELPPHDDAGRGLLLALAVTMMAASALTWGLSRGLARIPPARRRAIAVAVGLVAWADRQFESFRTFDAASRADAESVSERLAVAAGSGRWQNWEVAARQFRSEPLTGTGAGDYRFWWEAERDIDLTVRNAHSLYLETLGESGAIGLLLLLLPLGVVIAAVVTTRRRRPRDGARRRAGVAIAAAGVVVVHAGIDWDWQLPAVTLPAVALGGAVLKEAQLAMGGVVEMAAVERLVIATAALAAILVMWGPVASAAIVEDGRESAARGDLETALAAARRAKDLSPADPGPWLLEANLLSDLGRPAQASSAFSEAVARSPEDWAIFADWASSLGRWGDDRAAREAALRARALNPREARPRLLLEALAP
jgi:tetratricopeptide (TPR) repeat protein